MKEINYFSNFFFINNYFFLVQQTNKTKPTFIYLKNFNLSQLPPTLKPVSFLLPPSGMALASLKPSIRFELDYSQMIPLLLSNESMLTPYLNLLEADFECDIVCLKIRLFLDLLLCLGHAEMCQWENFKNLCIKINEKFQIFRNPEQFMFLGKYAVNVLPIIDRVFEKKNKEKNGMEKNNVLLFEDVIAEGGDDSENFSVIAIKREYCNLKHIPISPSLISNFPSSLLSFCAHRISIEIEKLTLSSSSSALISSTILPSTSLPPTSSSLPLQLSSSLKLSSPYLPPPSSNLFPPSSSLILLLLKELHLAMQCDPTKAEKSLLSGRVDKADFPFLLSHSLLIGDDGGFYVLLNSLSPQEFSWLVENGGVSEEYLESIVVNEDESFLRDEGGRRREEGGKRKEEGGKREKEGGKREKEGGKRKEEGGGGKKEDIKGKKKKEVKQKKDSKKEKKDEGGSRRKEKEEGGGRGRKEGKETEEEEGRDGLERRRKIIVGKGSFGTIRICLVLMRNKNRMSSIKDGEVVCVKKTKYVGQNVKGAEFSEEEMFESTWNDYLSVELLDEIPEIYDMKIVRSVNDPRKRKGSQPLLPPPSSLLPPPSSLLLPTPSSPPSY